MRLKTFHVFLVSPVLLTACIASVPKGATQTQAHVSTTNPTSSGKTDSLKTRQRAEALRAAIQAEKVKHPEVSQYWLRLACFEARDGFTEDAIAHGKIAIERFERHDSISRHISQILPAYGLAYILSNNKQDNAADQLMQLAVNKVKSTFGDQSLEYQAQLLHQFELYVAQKRYSEAAKCIDTIAECKDTAPSSLHDFREDDIFFANYILKERAQLAEEIRKCVFKTIRDKDCAFAVATLDKLTALDPLKDRVEKAKGHAYFLAQQYENAAKIYKHMYVNRYDAAGAEYILCMEALGNKAEIARILKEEAQKEFDLQKAHPPEIDTHMVITK